MQVHQMHKSSPLGRGHLEGAVAWLPPPSRLAGALRTGQRARGLGARTWSKVQPRAGLPARWFRVGCARSLGPPAEPGGQDRGLGDSSRVGCRWGRALNVSLPQTAVASRPAGKQPLGSGALFCNFAFP